MIRVGIIGMGLMGGVHLRNWQAVDGTQVVAVCDAKPIAGTAKQGNIDSDAKVLDLEGIAIHTDAAEMLATENLDAVSIALPTYLHKARSIQCLEAGVHVLCEKPMALNLDDCDAMIAASKKAGKQLMIAHCIRFWPEYIRLKQTVDAGEYGRIVAADFSRLSSAPGWDADSWFADQTKSGGIALDLHIHDLDFIQWICGAPAGIRSSVVKLKNGMPGHVVTTLDYGSDCVVTATASWMMPKSFGFKMAFSVVFEKAALIFDGGSLKLYPSDGEPVSPEISEGNGYIGEIRYFAELISGQHAGEERNTPEQSRASVRMALETTN